MLELYLDKILRESSLSKRGNPKHGTWLRTYLFWVFSSLPLPPKKRSLQCPCSLSHAVTSILQAVQERTHGRGRHGEKTSGGYSHRSFAGIGLRGRSAAGGSTAGGRLTRGGGGWGGGCLGASWNGGAGGLLGPDIHALGGSSRAVAGRVHGVERKVAILLDAAARVKREDSLAFGHRTSVRREERWGIREGRNWETDLWSIMTDEQLQASSVQ